MYSLYEIEDIKLLLNKYGFKISKSLGQNFIINRNVCPSMVDQSGVIETTGVIEVGSGLGILTCEIAKRAKKVVSFELDSGLIPILSETTADYGNVKIINRDVLKTDLNDLIRVEFGDCSDVRVCSNLPYYATSPILMKFLEEINVNSLTLMVQKEAANRICAVPGSRSCGAISLAVRYYSKPKILFSVGRNDFFPVPKVDSSVIKIDKVFGESNEVIDKDTFFRVVRATFMYRRKTLLNSLSTEFGCEKKKIAKVLLDSAIPEVSRPEQLSFRDFVKLSNSIYDGIV